MLLRNPAEDQVFESLVELDLASPNGDFRTTLQRLEEPMAGKYVRRIEAWLEMAAGIEARSLGAPSSTELPSGSSIGRSVSHPKFGRGVVRAVEIGGSVLLTVEFEEHGVKRIAEGFVTYGS